MKYRHRFTVRLLLLVAFIGLLLTTAGCAVIDNLLALGDNDTETATPVDIEVNSTGDYNFLTGGDEVDITLYFGDSNGKNLKMEKRSVPKAEGIARATVQELLKGPGNPDLSSVIPEGTELLDINLKPDGTCIVDLSHQLLSNDMDQTTGELAVYSVVNTLTEYPTVQQVEIMVEGQRVDWYAGNIDLGGLLFRNESLINE